jgi:hypothetical protein
MQGIVSTVINDITEKCDSDNLKQPLKEILTGVLQELANSMNEDFVLALNPEQKEDFQNYLGGLVQVLLVRLGYDWLDEQFRPMIAQLVQALFNYN